VIRALLLRCGTPDCGYSWQNVAEVELTQQPGGFVVTMMENR
jgi:hypothetical protein